MPSTAPIPASPCPVTLFGLEILPARFAEAVDILERAVEQRLPGAKSVFTPNVDHIVRLDTHPEWRSFYAQANYLFADGMPVIWASRLLGKPLPERVTGADLFVALCHRAVARQWQVVVLGGMPGEEQKLENLFAQVYPGLLVRVMCPSMQFQPDGQEGQEAADRIRAMAPDLVFVCLGLPKQERWIIRHAPGFPHGVTLGVGASMEFALGLKKRAPIPIQRLGFEWLWRLLSDPKRLWRRYLKEDPRFLALCWREYRRSRVRGS
ncbi:MAG: WecB/TagA/CpsF family glycosyltransferase [Pigmentiphaga sp.]|uniref:WecB/TagA/CpsF family glycosyltransferase n=1 Tax=Pigmentiphaga TaxID=152267 RepID=UPI0031DD7545